MDVGDYVTDPRNPLARRRVLRRLDLQVGPTFNGRRRSPRGERAVHRPRACAQVPNDAGRRGH